MRRSYQPGLILGGPFTQPEIFTGLRSLKQSRALLLFRCFMRSRLPAGYRRLCCQKLETLLNRTAGRLTTSGRLRTAEWRKNVAQDRECTVSCDSFSSFCLPESFSRSIAEGLHLPLTASYSALIFSQTLIKGKSNSCFLLRRTQAPPSKRFETPTTLHDNLYYYTSDSLWKIWLVESIQSIHNSLWTWHDKCIICCR